MISATPSMDTEDACDAVIASALSPFTAYNELLAQASALFQSRALWRDAIKEDKPPEIIDHKELRYRALRSEWHHRFKTSALPFCRQDNDLQLSDLERELLWGVMCHHLGEVRDDKTTINVLSLLACIAIEPTDRITALTCLTPEGTLSVHKLIMIAGNEDGDPLESEIIPDSGLVREVLQTGESRLDYWDLEHEEELYVALRPLYRVAEQISDDVARGRGYFRDRAAVARQLNRLEREWTKLELTLKHHPTWSWNRPEVRALPPDVLKVLVLLTARALDVLPEQEPLFSGQGLAAVASSDLMNYAMRYRLFRPDRTLLSENWIRPVGENAEHYSGQPSEIEQTRFELDDRAYETLNLKRSKGDTVAGVTLRDPRITLDQVSLLPSIAEAVQLTLVHARSEDRLLKDWGIAERVQYGLHPVLLFYGPPGTGKTATAEALAHELGRPLMVADYSKIQSCYVGVSEKNIVRVFREAQRKKAVLLWDEADAMLFDRDNATRSWEVREVNVILQEIERFHGVCILATNRRQNLDKALSRRISMQVEFQRPQTADERLRIWKAILPPQLPLAGDVDLARLAEEDLAGGDMKNVMLNAARFAAARDDVDPRLSNADFERAVQWEVQARDRKKSEIGFLVRQTPEPCQSQRSPR